MNQYTGKKRRSFLRGVAIVTLTLFLVPLSAETAIDQLYSQRQYELADAYWHAGQKFTELGQKERGDEFKAKALKLFPGYVPGKTPVFAPAENPPATPVASPSVPDSSVVREKNLQAEKIARLMWNKLLRGYLTANADTVASVLADTLTLPHEGAPEVVPSVGAAPKIAAFFADHAVEAQAPADLYDVASVTLAAGAEPGSVVLTVAASSDAPADLAAQFTFWKPLQHFTFIRDGESWKLSSITGE